MKNFIKIFFILIFALCNFAANATSEAKDSKGIWSAALENDIFANTDKHYTNGVKFSYLSPETSVSAPVEIVANKFLFFEQSGHKRFSYSIGQNMFTPKDISATSLQKSERPYAGWLYGSAGIISANSSRLDTFEITLGVVGKASLADKTQKFVHKIIGSPKPLGWSNQLKFEPGIIISYERQFRKIASINKQGLQADFTPSIGASIGNIYTNVSGGLMGRIGFDLPADYGPPKIKPRLSGSDYFEPTKNLGWYLFLGVNTTAAIRNIFLDGNSFKKSHKVKKKNLIGDLQAGITITYKSYRFGYTHVFRSKEFNGQVKPDQFGSLTLSARL